jgi:FtsP/CotA-like multicopper oxidase with cupredoxin domain
MKFLPTVISLLVAAALPTSAQVVNYQPTELVSSGGMLEVTLDVGLLESLNGTRIAPAYNGETVGPTLRLKPGDTFKVILKNSLDPGSALDRELSEYVMDPQNNVDSDANVTTIFNRLSDNGNIVSNSAVPKIAGLYGNESPWPEFQLFALSNPV